MVLRAIVLFLCLVTGLPAWAGKLAVVDISAQPDPDWRVHDRQLVVSLHENLAADPQHSLVSVDDVDALFREPAEPRIAGMLTEARKQLEKGKALSVQMRPGRAIVLLQRALRTLRAIFPEMQDLTLLEQVHLQLGVTYQALGKVELAAREYRMVLLLNPDRSLDEAVFNPVVIEHFGRVKHQLRSDMRGSLSLVSTPANAQVFVDGRPVGETPVTVPGVLPGEHYVAIRRNGYRTWSGRMKVAAGDLQRQDVFLTPGQSMHWVHLIQRLRIGGALPPRQKDATELAEALGVDRLVLVGVDHAEARTRVALEVFDHLGGRIHSLGSFALDEVRLAELALRVRTFQPAAGQALAVQALAPHDPRAIVTHSEPEDNAWYEQWWFWTAVGAAAIGVAATSAILLAPDSGLHIQVVR